MKEEYDGGDEEMDDDPLGSDENFDGAEPAA